MGKGKLIEWRPGCLAREGELARVTGGIWRFNGEAWRQVHRDGSHIQRTLDPTALARFELPADDSKRTKGRGLV